MYVYNDNDFRNKFVQSSCFTTLVFLTEWVLPRR
jgi:hypothetical protein